MARVFAHHSQYHVVGGPEIGDPSDPPEVPGLAWNLGEQALAVLTGIETGHVTVDAAGAAEPPPEIDEGWDVVGELELVSPDGWIRVTDWAGPAHEELPNLASRGPGRYRIRVCVRSRRVVDAAVSTETHHLLAWPVAAPGPARLLTSLDAYGRGVMGEGGPSAEPADVDRGAAAAVEFLAVQVHAAAPSALSGRVTTLGLAASVRAPRKTVRDIVSAPWTWLGIGGYPQGFSITVSRERGLEASGEMLESAPDRVLYTLAWHAPEDAWRLPQPPILVEIRLAGSARLTEAQLSLGGVPLELSEAVTAFFRWATSRLQARAERDTIRLPPWGR